MHKPLLSNSQLSCIYQINFILYLANSESLEIKISFSAIDWDIINRSKGSLWCNGSFDNLIKCSLLIGRISIWFCSANLNNSPIDKVKFILPIRCFIVISHKLATLTKQEFFKFLILSWICIGSFSSPNANHKKVCVSSKNYTTYIL